MILHQTLKKERRKAVSRRRKGNKAVLTPLKPKGHIRQSKDREMEKNRMK